MAVAGGHRSERDEDSTTGKKSVAEGLWRKCDACGEALLAEEFEKNLEVCPRCQQHGQLGTRAWIDLIADPGTFRERDATLSAADPLGFKDNKKYKDRIRATRKATGFADALVSGSAAVEGIAVDLGFFVFEFQGGSMGSVVGEKIARLFEHALAARLPVVIFNASGGARMQEGIYSLMQMAKSVSALARHRDAGLAYLSILLNPTTGGVAASFASLGDVIIAEPKALIGFAGPRVIEQTIRQKLPPGFQRAEFLLDHGFVDFIAPRHEMKARIAQVLRHLGAASAG